MRPVRLESAGLDLAMKDVPNWRRVSDGDGKDAIRCEFVFADFNAAFGFMTRVAMKAERLDHHPDWSNSYKRVTITLTTHDAGGVTALDLKLARFCDESARSGQTP